MNLQDREGDSDQHVNDSIQEERNSKYAQKRQKLMQILDRMRADMMKRRSERSVRSL